MTKLNLIVFVYSVVLTDIRDKSCGFKVGV